MNTRTLAAAALSALALTGAASTEANAYPLTSRADTPALDKVPHNPSLTRALSPARPFSLRSAAYSDSHVYSARSARAYVARHYSRNLTVYVDGRGQRVATTRCSGRKRSRVCVTSARRVVIFAAWKG